ncbi:MAG: hypothetical protein ACHQQS_17135, partial [Thermoanaerobaculales bacterium]
ARAKVKAARATRAEGVVVGVVGAAPAAWAPAGWVATVGAEAVTAAWVVARARAEPTCPSRSSYGLG